MEKLEILSELKNIYGEKINIELSSIKYCQNESSVILEMYFFQSPEIPVCIDLEFIRGEIIKDANGADKDIIPMFQPYTDIVDSAQSFIHLDTYSLMMCIENLFSKSAEEEINREYMDNLNN